MIELVIVGVCLIFNAVLACVEMAFVSVGRPQLRQMAQSGNKDAQRLLRLRDNPERTLSILQIGITLVGAVSAAVGGAGAEESLTPWLQSSLGVGEGTGEILSILIIVIPLTYLSVVVGELVPKTIALKRPLQIAFFGSRWLAIADTVFAPIVTALEWSTKKILTVFFRRVNPEVSHDHTDPNLEIATLSDQHRQFVINLVYLEKKRIRDILLPWSQVTTVESRQPLSEVAGLLLSSGHSRMPVIEDGKPKGFIYSKELMALSASGDENWQSIVRPVLAVREHDTLLRVLRLMQEKRSHLSLVYSNDNVLLGIITLEDIIEEVVGDIYDEDDDGSLKRILASGRKLRAATGEKQISNVPFRGLSLQGKI